METGCLKFLLINCHFFTYLNRLKALRSELQDLTPDLAIAATCPLVFTIVESYRFDIRVMTKNHRVFSHFLIFALRKIC